MNPLVNQRYVRSAALKHEMGTCEMMHFSIPCNYCPSQPLRSLTDQVYFYCMNVSCWKTPTCGHERSMNVYIPPPWVQKSWRFTKCDVLLPSDLRGGQREDGQGNEKTKEQDEKLDAAACFMHNVIILLDCPSNFRQTERPSDREIGQRAARWIAVQWGVCG